MDANQESWDKLCRRILDFAADQKNLTEVAELISKIMPVYLEEPIAREYFEFWQRKGFHVTPVHYYQPVPDTRDLPDELWEIRTRLAGIDMNERVQVDLLRRAFPPFKGEWEGIPTAPTERPYDFYFNNGAIDGTDALVLYCMVRHFKPNLVLEVGSGFSSRLTARAGLVNGNTRLICIEPYPDDIMRDGFPGLHTLLPIRVQEAGFGLFQQLGANDILFIDSSHVVKCGGDVNYLFLEVLPRLNPGVIVHIHDIFLPNELPKELVREHHFFWTEQYLLQAFLMFNTEFEVLFANSYMARTHNREMIATFPDAIWCGGGSFWIRRKQEQLSK